MEKLGQEKQQQYLGDFVLETQTVAKDFKNVSKAWEDKCLSYDEVLDKVAEGQRMIEDIRSPLSDWKPAVSADGECVLQYKDGRSFAPTQHALKHLAVNGYLSTGYLQGLGRDKEHPTKGGFLFTRDSGDAELMAYTLEKTLFRSDRVDQDKERLFRTWTDGTLRAMLSHQYAIINNSWFMETVTKTVKDGKISHWRGDHDNIFGNILIPDSIREEDDSDYGGMLSIGNSEIGMRTMSSQPSVFRAICMNGCIWDKQSGSAIKQVHKGNIDLTLLREEIIENLTAQIPLVDSGIDVLLKLREHKVNGVAPMSNVIAQTVKGFGITKKHATGVMEAFLVEKDILGNEANSAFGVVNAITRFGQTLDDASWLKLDQVGGEMANITAPRWEALVNQAKVMSDKEIEKSFSKSLAF